VCIVAERPYKGKSLLEEAVREVNWTWETADDFKNVKLTTGGLLSVRRLIKHIKAGADESYDDTGWYLLG
jgi:hypothetical protein